LPFTALALALALALDFASASEPPSEAAAAWRTTDAEAMPRAPQECERAPPARRMAEEEAEAVAVAVEI